MVMNVYQFTVNDIEEWSNLTTQNGLFQVHVRKTKGEGKEEVIMNCAIHVFVGYTGTGKAILKWKG